MPAFGPIKRRDLLRHLRPPGFDGPYVGGRRQFMVKGQLRLVIPNPHRDEIPAALLSRILRQAGVERAEWEQLQ